MRFDLSNRTELARRVLLLLAEDTHRMFKGAELAEKAQAGRRVRLGGLVVEGTLRRDADGASRFAVTDGAVQVEVRYDGVLPDLFREGQGVVAEGAWTPGQAFEAERVLAKHDETYMPREVAEALKQRGEWKGQ